MIFQSFSERQTIRRRQIVAQAREKDEKAFSIVFPSARRFAEGKSWHKREKKMKKLFSIVFRAPDDSAKVNRGTDNYGILP